MGFCTPKNPDAPSKSLTDKFTHSATAFKAKLSGLFKKREQTAMDSAETVVAPAVGGEPRLSTDSTEAHRPRVGRGSWWGRVPGRKFSADSDSTTKSALERSRGHLNLASFGKTQTVGVARRGWRGWRPACEKVKKLPRPLDPDYNPTSSEAPRVSWVF
ncbi:hypothetical protein HDU98_010848 [Podochytrium sp. JEL0797]|nr:hypothetical protein HDU98_010848 [Podochytrium sp. JEL0797]